MASPILNVTEFWIASTGEILDQSGTSQFHAQNNYANLILVNLEDGGGYDSTTFINFTPQTKTAYTSHWFYMSYQGLVEHEVGGEVRNFAQYAIRVPRVVLQNSNKNGFTINDVIVKQTYGDNFIGQFDTLASLNSEYPPTEALDDANSVAYVVSDLNSAQRGFYQVELDGTYGWALMESVALTLETKQYNGVQIQVQAGSANPADVVSVSEETVKILMGILNNLQVDVDRIDANIDEVEDDAILLEARVSTNEEDIGLLEGRATVNEEDIDLLEGRATNLETFQNTTVPATYETISNVDLVKDRVEDLETFQEVTVPATYETKAVVSGISTLISSLDLSKLNKDFTSLIEEVSLSLSDVFVVDKGSGARKVSLGTIASYLSTQELELFTIVEELPMENQNPNTIYLLVTENEEGQNQLLEYIWIANQERWELIGSLEVDLSNYYTKAETDNLIEQNKGVFWVEYGVTTYAEIENALSQGLLPIAIKDGYYYTYVVTPSPTTGAYFQNVWLGTNKHIYVTDDNVWATRDVSPEFASNKTNTLTSSSTTTQYPNAKVVYDLGEGKVDKVAGKGLSTEDYTTVEKNKLSGIQAGAQVNKEPDNITIGLNEENKLEVKNNLEIDGGFL